jgi:hypothetical protein
LIPNLEQPEWRKLLLAERNEFSDAYDSWASRMEVARQKNRPGDILDARRRDADRALHWKPSAAPATPCSSCKQPELALEQFDTALERSIPATTRPVARREAICLGLLNRFEEARECVSQATHRRPSA